MGNLIINGGFEGGFAPWQGLSSLLVAEGWTPWWKPAASGDPPWKLATPEFKAALPPFTNRVRSGLSSQQWFTADKTHSGGIFQRVAVPSGATVNLSAWAQAWSTKGNDPTSGSPENGRDNGHLEARIGLDLDGNTNPWSPDIVWSDWTPCYDRFVSIALAGVARGAFVTVYLMSECMYPVSHNDIYFDDVALTVDGDAPPVVEDAVLAEVRRIADAVEVIAAKL